ncbi:MAG TPA: hypothetical protein VF516_14995, partial [Kofleriaceae bacterium]
MQYGGVARERVVDSAGHHAARTARAVPNAIHIAPRGERVRVVGYHGPPTYRRVPDALLVDDRRWYLIALLCRKFPGRNEDVGDVGWIGCRQDETMIQHSLLVLILLTSTAIAQPGTAPPAEQPAPAGTDLDALIAKAQAEAPTIETVVRGTFRRARRALSIGPTVGLWTGAIIGPGDIDAALTIGVGFETFKVPVLPEMETIQDLIVERVKAQLKQR